MYLLSAEKEKKMISLAEPLITCHRLNRMKQSSVKFEYKRKHFVAEIENVVYKISAIFENKLSWNRYYYSDIIMSTMTSQITSLTIIYSTVYSCADQRKHQSSASLAFVRGLHRWPVNSPHKGPVTRKMFSFDDVIMWRTVDISYLGCVLSPWSFGSALKTALNAQ